MGLFSAFALTCHQEFFLINKQLALRAGHVTNTSFKQ